MKTQKRLRFFFVLLTSFLMSFTFNTQSQIVDGPFIIDGLADEWDDVAVTGLETFRHLNDPFGNTLDTSFTQGSKDFMLAADLRWTYGQTKNKNDLCNVAAVFHAGHLHFAGDRAKINGDAQIGFWLYLNGTGPSLCPNPNNPSDPFKCFAPEHVQGDLLILADFTGGGNTATVTVYQWQADNTLLDVTTIVGGADVAENNAGPTDVPNYGGSTPTYNTAFWYYPTAQYPTNGFYEGYVTIPDPPPGMTYDLCNSSFLLEARSSQSLTASLDDFVGGSFNLTPPPPVPIPAERCGAGTVTLDIQTPYPDVIKWYSDEALTTLVFTGRPFITPSISTSTTYWVTATNTGEGYACESEGAEVTASIFHANPGEISGSQTLCAPFNPVAFTSTTPGSGDVGAVITYQWQSSTVSCSSGMTNISGATSETYDPGIITMTTYYRRVTTATYTGIFCTAISNCLTVTPNNVTPGTIAGDQTLCSPFDPAAFTVTTPATGSGTLTYQWQIGTAGCGGAFADIAGATSATYNAPAIAVVTYFRRIVTSTLNGVPCAATSNCLTVTPNNVTPGVIAGDQTLCSPFDPVAFTSTTPGSGSGVITYQWQIGTGGCAGSFANIAGATSATYDAPAVAVVTYFRRVATSTLNGVPCSANSNCLTVTPNSVTPGTIAGDQTLCAPFDPAAFTVTTPATGSGALTYQWQIGTAGCGGAFSNISGATSATYDAPAVAVVTYFRRIVTSTLNGVPCASTSNCLTVTPNNVTPGVIAGDQTLCSPFDPAAFTSTTPGSGSGVITYQWQIGTGGCAGSFANISGATSATYDAPAVAVVTYFRRVATSTLNGVPCSANSNCLTVTPNNVTPGVIAGDQTLCSPFDPVAFTSTTPGSGSGVITYQWQIGTGGCAGSFANIAGATSATYDAPAVAVITYFRRVATSTLNGVPCSANSNCLTVTPNNVTPGVIAGDQTLCSPFDPAAFTSTTLGSGSGVITYQWQIGTGGCAGSFANIAGATSATYDAPAVAVVTYFRRVATSTLNGVPCSAISNCLTVTLIDLDPGSISGDQTGCPPFDPIAFGSVAATASPGASITYQWQSSTTSCTSGMSNIPGATGATYNPGAISTTTWFRRAANATLGGVTCTEYSNCVIITIVPCCETAYGRSGETAECFYDYGFSQWGWTNFLDTYTTLDVLDLFQSNPDCDPIAENWVGQATVTRSGNMLTVAYDMIDGFSLDAVHVYVGCGMFPLDNNGQPTVAPGQYTYVAGAMGYVNQYTVTFPSVTGDVWVIAHAESCEVPSTASGSGTYGGDPIACPNNPPDSPTGIKPLLEASKDIVIDIHPNPFVSATEIDFRLSWNGEATVEVYNMLGVKVARLFNGEVDANVKHTTSFRIPDGFGPGVYFCIIRTEKGSAVKRMILTR